MKGFEQQKYLDATIYFVANEFFPSDSDSKFNEPITPSKTISGAAGFLSHIIKDNNVLKDHVVSALTRSTIPSLNYSVAIRRGVIATLSRDEGTYIHVALISSLTLNPREAAYTTGKRDKVVRGLCLYQAHPDYAARRYIDLTAKRLLH